MVKKIGCYVRPMRMEWALSQEDLASLLPRCRRSRISDIERGVRGPNANELLGLSIVFDLPPHHIFRRYAEELEDEIARRVRKFEVRLETKRNPRVDKKRELINHIPHQSIIRELNAML